MTYRDLKKRERNNWKSPFWAPGRGALPALSTRAGNGADLLLLRRKAGRTRTTINPAWRAGNGDSSTATAAQPSGAIAGGSAHVSLTWPPPAHKRGLRPRGEALGVFNSSQSEARTATCSLRKNSLPTTGGEKRFKKKEIQIESSDVHKAWKTLGKTYIGIYIFILNIYTRFVKGTIL